MLRKMFLVSPEHMAAGRQQHSPPSPAKHAQTRNVQRRRRETKKQHPYDKWVRMKRGLEDADIERKALTQKIADFLQKVLPSSATYAGQPVPPATPDVTGQVSTSEAAGPPDTASPSVPPFLSRTHESVFASPIKRSLSMDSEEERSASYVPGDSTVHAYSAQQFGTVASPYVSAYAVRTGIVDSDFGMRRDVDGKFRIGNATVVIDQDSNVDIRGKTYKGTRGLFEL